jgi:Rhodopirellula transposase DDE domain
MIDYRAIRRRWEADGSNRDERGRRLFAASEARASGWGGVASVSSITGLARSTIGRGLKDLDARPLAAGRVRREGGGPRPLTETDATLLDDLRTLVEPATLGDPGRPLLWVSKSLDKLACALVAMGHSISPNSVRKLLTEIGYSRQVNRKADEGSSHPDRNAQFEYINAEVLAAQAAGEPVISVDTKKKELVGNYRNAGGDWRPKGDPERVKVHDFEDKTLGKVAPYGVYDVAADAGWVSLGITCDTAEFAVASIRTWLERIGRARYPKAGELMITADCGGSNGSRVRLWKVELQKLADETGLTIKVRHYPPGTSKWNKACPREGGDRAPPVLPHHAELARPAAHRPRHHHRTHRGHNHQDRAQSRERTRHEGLRERHQGHQSRDETSRHPRRSVPPRMELLGCSPEAKFVALIAALVLKRIMSSRMRSVTHTSALDSESSHSAH